VLSAPYVTGSPNWIDLGTPDVEAAKVFYGGLFGWTFASACRRSRDRRTGTSTSRPLTPTPW
jgi:predicted enzyme related to lactoylglutathione lyase